MKEGKKHRAAKAQLEAQKLYPLEDAVAMAVKLKHTKFDETLDLAMRLGVDPKHADQMVRGSVVLPHGTGKTIRVLAIAKGDKEAEARAAGADFVGAEDMIEKIQGGWLDFDALVATPDTMGLVGRLGKVLGPRGLMPSPKTGSVTMDIGKAVSDLKAGKVEYRVDRAGNVHSIVGKSSFPVANLVENAKVLIDAIVRARPATAKGQYVKRIALSTTMGPGVHVDHTKMGAEVKH